MPYIQLNDTRHPLRVGAMRVGAAPDAELRLPGASDPVAAAVVEVGADQSASIRRAHESAVVLVNGVRLGVHPAPLIHGDKIELGGHELLFGDDKKSGSTQYVPSMGAHHASGSAGAPGTVANNGAGPRTGLATGATGGLLRSLVDGREYPVAESGLVIGRDAGCDVVVPSGEVSRRHAAIMPTGAGYQLRDTSTNGVWVNGTRIEGVATLGRGDVVRIGGEEFRFYADAGEPAGVPAGAPNAAAAATPSAAAPRASAPLVAPVADFELAVPKPARPEPATNPAGASGSTGAPGAVGGGAPARPQPSAAPQAAPAAPAPAAPAPVAPAPAAPARAALATLEVVNEGVLKGQRFEIHHPLAHVGRGDHNDVVLADESVSDSHAKVQKREGRWFVVDMGSTNGTYVAGTRLAGEQELVAGADVRFGGIKLRFQPLADRAEDAKSTRVIAGANPEVERRAVPRSGAPARRPAAAPASAPPAAKRSPAFMIVLFLLLVAAAAAYFLGIGR